MDASRTANYLRDLGDLLRRSATEAKQEADAAKGTAEQEFKEGRLLAYHEVVSLMQQQAKVFGLSLAAICLDGINPERDLV